MLKMYRCPCHKEEFTQEEFDNLPTNEFFHKYCKVQDCYEYSSDYEVFYKQEPKDELITLKILASKYGYTLDKNK